jgi:ribonuclease Z
VFREAIATRVMQRVVTRNLTSSPLTELPDGLHVGLCGAGSPLPDVDRSGPCVAVIAGGKLYVIDSGSGSSRVLARMRLPQGRIEAAFLTHFHSDHIDGLGELMLQRWAGGGNAQPLPVFGPSGVERVVAGFNEAYAQDFVYRIAHHGAAVIPPGGAGGSARPFDVPAPGAAPVIFSDGDLRVSVFAVDHTPVAPAVGYRFDYKGRSAVISGDTVKSANLQAIAKGADLLVHEALSPELVGVMTNAAADAGVGRIEKITVDIVDYHTSPVQAAEIARDAGVGQLLFYHIVPPLPMAILEDIFLEGVADIYSGPVTLGRDGTLVQMPAGSTDITLSDEL